jgi:LDH2 family malate/lactate/ureidoglycolate dehydrogenase
LKLAAMAGRSVPEGWTLNTDGTPLTDPDIALTLKRMTPLGGTPGMSSHKGYGLAAMVEILSSLLSGATFAPLRPAGEKALDVGHFFMAIDPGAFRDAGDFRKDVDAMMTALRSSPPADPNAPVLVPGDPEHAARRDRERAGIPVPDPLLAAVAAMAERAGAPFLLDEHADR